MNDLEWNGLKNEWNDERIALQTSHFLLYGSKKWENSIKMDFCSANLNNLIGMKIRL